MTHILSNKDAFKDALNDTLESFKREGGSVFYYGLAKPFHDKLRITIRKGKCYDKEKTDEEDPRIYPGCGGVPGLYSDCYGSGR